MAEPTGRTLQLIFAIRDARAPWLRGGSAKAVLYALAAHMGLKRSIFPSLETLGAAAGLSERSTGPIVTMLAERGLIEVVRGSQHTPNKYRLREEALAALSYRVREEDPSALDESSQEDASPLTPGQRGRSRSSEMKKPSSRHEAASYKEDLKSNKSISVADATDFQLSIVPKSEPTDHQKVIAHYSQIFASTHGGEKPEIGKADGAWVQQSLTKRGLEKTCALISNWFADPWRAANRPSLRSIDPNAATAPTTPNTRVNAQPWTPGSRDWTPPEET